MYASDLRSAVYFPQPARKTAGLMGNREYCTNARIPRKKACEQMDGPAGFGEL